jgi:hypothetical protein
MEDLLTYLLTPAAQIALVIGLAEVFKKTGFPLRFIPILDLFLGMMSGIFVYGVFLDQGIGAGIILGIGIGLSACGTFSGIKNVLQKHDTSYLFDREEDDDDQGT